MIARELVRDYAIYGHDAVTKIFKTGDKLSLASCPVILPWWPLEILWFYIINITCIHTELNIAAI